MSTAITMSILAIGLSILIIFLTSFDADNSHDRTVYRIIASVVCSPFVLGSFWFLIKSICINNKNK